MQGDRILLSHNVNAYCRSVSGSIAGTSAQIDRDGRKSHDIGGCDLMGLGEKIASRYLTLLQPFYTL